MRNSNWLPAGSKNRPALPGQTEPSPVPYVIAQSESYNAADEGSVNLADYARILWRRKGTFLLIVLLGVLAGAGISALQPRIYQSLASVEVQGLNENFLNLKDVNPNSQATSTNADSYVVTQSEILQQDTLLQRVVKKLNLERNPEFIQHPGVADKVRTMVGMPAAPQAPPLVYATSVAKENLKVVTPRTGQVIKIYYDSRDPRVAADFANTLVQVFIDQNVESRWQAAQQIKEWLRPQLEDLKARMDRAQAQLQGYSQGSGLLISDGAQENVASEKLRLLQAELTKAQSERMAKEPIYGLSRSGSEGVAENTAVREYELRLTDLRRQLADLETMLTPENYKVVRLKAQVAELENALKRENANTHRRVQNDYESTQKREALLSQAYTRQAGTVADVQSKMVRYQTLKHDVETSRQAYDAMLQKVNEAGVASAIRPTNIRMVGPAEPATQPYKPNLPLNIGIGLFAGLVMGVGCVMLLEQTNRRLVMPGDTAIMPLLVELGAIPAAPRLNGLATRLLRSGAKDGMTPEGLTERITWEQKDSEFSESFRNVLASILLPANSGETPRVLVVTSPQPGEGKTTVASNLAIALAEIKHRVLLIDGDMRKPRLHGVFDVPNTTGLSDLLCEKEAILDLPTEQLVRKTQIPNLFVIPSGPGPDGIFNKLYSPRMMRLFCRFREEFDHVIIDAPPCLEFADARILARNADGVILVFRANKTDKRTALAVVEQLMRDRIRIVGTVLNDWNSKHGKGYSDYYNYGRPNRTGSAGEDHPILVFGAPEN